MSQYVQPRGQMDQYSTQPVPPGQQALSQWPNPYGYGDPSQVTNPVQLVMPGWMDWNNSDWARSDGAQKSLQNWNTLLPYLQYRQNSYQYGQDFNEAQRRWNSEFDWQKQGDQFAQNLAGRQEDRAWWTANQAADQWGKQFGLDSELGRGNLQLSRDKMNTDAQVAREGYANQAKVANIQAFGRAQTPNARWLRSW